MGTVVRADGGGRYGIAALLLLVPDVLRRSPFMPGGRDGDGPGV